MDKADYTKTVKTNKKTYIYRYKEISRDEIPNKASSPTRKYEKKSVLSKVQSR